MIAFLLAGSVPQALASKQGCGPNTDDLDIQHGLRALAIIKDRFGEQHLDTAKIYNNLGFLYTRKGQFGLAIQHYKKTLAIKGFKATKSFHSYHLPVQ